MLTINNQTVDFPSDQSAPELKILVGQRLRAQREAHNWSVAQVAEALKSSVRRIQALEAGEWDDLLPLPYLRGLLRNYAKLIQFDATALLSDVDTIFRSQVTSTTKVGTLPVLHARSSGKKNFHPWPWLAVILLIVVVGIWYFNASWVMSNMVAIKNWFAAIPVQSQPQALAPSLAAVAQVEKQAPIVQSIAHTQPITGAAESTLAGLDVKSADLVLRFRDESWTEVRQSDGRILLSQLNFANSEQTIRGTEPFELVIGNATAVRLFHHGMEVDLTPYIRENVARLTLSSSIKVAHQ